MLSAIHRIVWTGLLLVILLFASTANATPVTITQHYGPILDPIYVNGTSQTVTGDWIFTIVTDTSNPDLDPGDTRGGLFDAVVTLTNSGLGLTDVGVTSFHYYWEWVEPGWTASGITGASYTGGWGLVAADGAVGDPNVIESSFLDFTSIDPYLWIYYEPLELENGMTIYTYSEIHLSDGYQTTGNPVPEPATMLLFGTGLVGIAGTRLRRKKSA